MTLVDVELDSDQDLVFDDTNAVPLIRDDPAIEQSLGIDTLEVSHELVGGPLTPSLVNRLKADVRSSLDANPYVDDVLAVEITDLGDDSVTVEVTLESTELVQFDINL